MPNTNIESQESYNVKDAWPITEPRDANDCWEQLVRLATSGQASAYHGAYRNWRCILSSLDVHFEKEKIPTDQRLQIETRLLESFAEEADPHFSPGARLHIELARLKWKTLRNTGTVFVGRHYGLPTRCVDWTSAPLIALFFACRREFNEPGVVWWMNNDQFSDRLAEQWPTAYKKKIHVENDFERDFIDGGEKKILIRFGYPAWMERPTKQDAWITLAGKYGVRHDEAIHQLRVRECGRLIIRPPLKRDLLNRLNRLGVSGASLGLGDACVETIAADVARQFLCNAE